MQFNKPLKRGVLQKRYKRFLADIDFGDGHITTVHCPNTGAMTGCAKSGYNVYCSESDNTKRKYPLTWELAQDHNGHYIVVNTQRANALAGEALHSKQLAELASIEQWLPEQKYGEQNSRIDWLGIAQQQQCFVEVKSVTLAEGHQGYFPDAVSTRGQKHLQELIKMRQQGHRAVLLFMVMHQAIEQVSPATHIDDKYAVLCRQAADTGVEFYALRANISEHQLTIDCQLPIILDPDLESAR